MKITKVMGRRRFIFDALSLVGLGLVALNQDANAVEALDPEILKNQLCVKTDAEEAFVDDVIDKAKSGELPMKFLTNAYRYAIQKNKSQRVVYFKRALEALCKRAGRKIEFKSF